MSALEEKQHTDERDILDQLQDGIALLEAGRDDDTEAFEILAHLSDFFNGALPAELDENAPLKLEQAICLPELNGIYTVNPELRTPSESFSIKTLRRAISDGQLAVLKPNTKNQFLTKRAVKEWLSSCLDPVNPRILSSEKNAVTPKVGSRTMPYTSSKMATSKLALDAAEKTLAALKSS